MVSYLDFMQMLQAIEMFGDKCRCSPNEVTGTGMEQPVGPAAAFQLSFNPNNLAMRRTNDIEVSNVIPA